jgi:competence protein ComEC
MLAESVAVAAAAHVVTAPVIAALSGRVSLVAVPANVLAEPAVAPATVLGFGAALVAPEAVTPARLLADLAGWPCRWLVGVADRFGAVDGAAVPWPDGTGGGLLLVVVGATLWLLARGRRARALLAGAGLICGLVQVPLRAATSAWPPPRWAFVACDVGQGDGLVLRAGPGAAVVIDTGPDPVLMQRCLDSLGITEVPLLAVTHDHLDHLGGLAAVFRGRRVGAVVTGPLAEPATGAAALQEQARAHRLVVRVPAPATALRVGAVRLDVLGPASAFTGTRSDPNNSSLVLRATVQGMRILLPGDAEVEAQHALLQAGIDLRADVLKVPHHGSAYSDPRFLAAVHARLAVISVGLHNDYGHPSPLLLAEMQRLGVPVLRTDLDGDIAVTVQDGRVGAVTRSVAAASALGPGTLLRRGCRGCTEPRPTGQTHTALVGTAASRPGDRMTACPRRARSVPMPCPPTSRQWCSSSAMRNCSSPGPWARSPPRCGAPHPT